MIFFVVNIIAFPLIITLTPLPGQYSQVRHLSQATKLPLRISAPGPALFQHYPTILVERNQR
jgi:hypothetical protein